MMTFSPGVDTGKTSTDTDFVDRPHAYAIKTSVLPEVTGIFLEKFKEFKLSDSTIRLAIAVRPLTAVQNEGSRDLEEENSSSSSGKEWGKDAKFIDSGGEEKLMEFNGNSNQKEIDKILNGEKSTGFSTASPTPTDSLSSNNSPQKQPDRDSDGDCCDCCTIMIFSSTHGFTTSIIFGKASSRRPIGRRPTSTLVHRGLDFVGNLPWCLHELHACASATPTVFIYKISWKRNYKSKKQKKKTTEKPANERKDFLIAELNKFI